MWTAYGLGNYVSNQDEACCAPATAGAMLMTASVAKPADSPAHVTRVE